MAQITDKKSIEQYIKKILKVKIFITSIIFNKMSYNNQPLALSH